MRSAYLIVSALLVTGCASSDITRVYPPLAKDIHKLERHYSNTDRIGLAHLSCTDQIDGESAYKAFEQDDPEVGRTALAVQNFAYSAMANNVYRTPDSKPIFEIPHWHYLSRYESNSGLSVDVYGSSSTIDASSEIAVAFRGTDFTSLEDWGANLALLQPKQYREAYSLIQMIKNKHPDVLVTVTGHSLGGAIALNISLRIEGVNVVAFNSSPRAFFGHTRDLPNRRVHLYEVGEILNLLSGPWLRFRLPNSTLYGNYNFLDYKLSTVSPVPEHGIYEMTRGLLVIAMANGSEAARKMFIANIDVAQAMKVDPEACGPLYANSGQ